MNRTQKAILIICGVVSVGCAIIHILFDTRGPYERLFMFMLTVSSTTFLASLIKLREIRQQSN